MIFAVCKKSNQAIPAISIQLKFVGQYSYNGEEWQTLSEDTDLSAFDGDLTLRGRFDIELKCKGDVDVDFHHTAEDIGICLGQAFCKALGDKKGIVRYGNMILPMDEALILTAVDLSGRSCLGYTVDLLCDKVGDFDTELVEEFWQAFVREADCTLHIKQMAGRNTHHIIEGIFKSAARSFKAAATIDPSAKDEIPSTKGVL